MDEINVITISINNATLVAFSYLPYLEESRDRKLWLALLVDPVVQGGANILMPECIPEDTRYHLTFFAGAPLIAWY